MSGMFHNAKLAIAICTPIPTILARGGGHLILDTVSAKWHRSRMGLSIPTNINLVELHADGMEVGDARSKVAAECLKHDPRPEFLFFLDYDVLAPYDAMTKLLFRAKCYPDYDIYAGVYCCKNMSPPDPLIYGENGMGAIWNWSVGDLLTTESHGVKSVHMGLTLVRVNAFQKLLDAGLVHGDGTDQEDEPFFRSINTQSQTTTGAQQIKRGTEDIYMCDKLMKAGGKIFVDTSVLAGHEDKGSGMIFGLPMDDGPVKRARWLKGKDDKYQDECDAEKEGLKLALDIGAGGERRQWQGYKTFTTDIRADTKPDYVQDTRWLNLPENHYDLVASSHHLEHVGRWDQEMVWKEMFRICKPGGRIEHIVPSVEWAAAKIVAGEMDEHVMNVLYGAQEIHGYNRIYNLHYFGYTAALAKELAEAAGFVDVTTEDWRQNPDYALNMVIRGRKPEAEEKKEEKKTEEEVASATEATQLSSSYQSELKSVSKPREAE